MEGALARAHADPTYYGLTVDYTTLCLGFPGLRGEVLLL